MRKFLLLIIGCSFLKLLSAQTPEINPDGIVFPYLPTVNQPALAKVGTMVWNPDRHRLELFSDNFIWEGLYGNLLRDADLDSGLEIFEGLSQSSGDYIQIKTDNLLRFSISDQARFNTKVEVFGALETEDASIFMRNLGSTDTDQGIKWGEGNNDPIFGLVYDGEGNGANSELHLREYNFTDSDVISFRADGNVKVHNLSGSNAGPVYATIEGELTRSSGQLFKVYPAMVFRADDWSDANTMSSYNKLDLPPIVPPFSPPSLAILFSLPRYYTRLDLPHGVQLTRLEFTYQDNCATCEFHIYLHRVSLSYQADGEDMEEIAHFNTSFSSAFPIRTGHFTLNETIDNEHYYYVISVINAAFPLNPNVQFYNAQAFYNY